MANNLDPNFYVYYNNTNSIQYSTMPNMPIVGYQYQQNHLRNGLLVGNNIPLILPNQQQQLPYQQVQQQLLYQQQQQQQQYTNIQSGWQPMLQLGPQPINYAQSMQIQPNFNQQMSVMTNWLIPEMPSQFRIKITFYDVNACSIGKAYLTQYSYDFAFLMSQAKKRFESFHIEGQLAGFYTDNTKIQDDSIWLPFLRIMLTKGSKELDLCCFTEEDNKDVYKLHDKFKAFSESFAIDQTTKNRNERKRKKEDDDKENQLSYKRPKPGSKNWTSDEKSKNKNMSKTTCSDLDELFVAYNIDFTRINELGDDESKEKAKNEFLSIFDIGVTVKIDSSKVQPIKDRDQEIKDCIGQIREMGILKDTKYILKNVNDENNEPPYTLELPLWRKTFIGKPDAIIVEATGTNQCVVLMIEFKSRGFICDREYQGIMKYIGGFIKSAQPVLYVQTDMNDFRFLLMLKKRANGSIDLFEFKIIAPNSLNGFDLINNWVKLIHLINTDKLTETDEKIQWYHKMRDIRITLKEHYTMLSDLPKQLHSRVINPDQIADAYNREKVVICNDKSCRTGTVYKITIGRYSYALKVPRKNEENYFDILKEMENEADIYQHLTDIQLRNGISDDKVPWTRLYYSGPLQIKNNGLEEEIPFAIVTNYIDGTEVKLKAEHEDKPYKKWEYVDSRDFLLCKNALKLLNSYGILHGDARTSNFLIVNGEVAKILDFGFSECLKYTFRESLKNDEES